MEDVWSIILSIEQEQAAIIKGIRIGEASKCSSWHWIAWWNEKVKELSRI
jgi:hypothetical protein